ncbi:hypothetical protein O0L34_g6856 [Tuta absoluta]|nr:hypothetical protein O0L34_g6856 [Tuta absoluta]
MSARLPASDLSLRFVLFTPCEVDKLMRSHIAPKRSTDMYGLSANILKGAITPILYVICQLFNMCLRSGTYPRSLKRVKISPLYKGKGKKSDIKSYRPISLVPVISKILEVGLNKRLLAFISGGNALSDRQYAYRTGRTTTDLVREVVYRVLNAREEGRHVALVCCDLSRAFDTANHALVADKLSHYGIRGLPLDLLVSFMSQRTQAVVGDKGRLTSAEMENIMGVPQGSCLSNTLFSLLLNDLPQAIDNAELYMYADDVAAVVTACTKQELEQNLNVTVQALDGWFRSNGLALNRDKTCYMIFNLNGKAPQPFKVYAGDTQLKLVKSTKLLGFHVDCALTWESHIDHVTAKLGGACFALRRLANTATREVVRACYFATIHSNVTYGLELWGRAADWERAFVLQKRALRAMAGIADDAESCVPLFREFNILTLPSEYVYQIALFTHVNLDNFKRKDENKRHNLRSNALKQQLATPFHKLARSEKSVYIAGPSIYNRLPHAIRDAASTVIFKNKIKKWLSEHQFYSVDEMLKFPIII